jgi:cystathionine beta-synthase
LNEEIPNSYWCNQYDNFSNRQAHFESTGPEIWEQTEGKITHFVVGVGTGGTISGVGRYLKSKNPDVKIWGIDTYGSVFKKYHETGIFDEKEIYPYVTEGIGEDILPKNVDFEVIDLFEKVTDKDAAVMTRMLVQQEGILVGNSAGSAMAGLIQLKDQLKPTDVVVVLFHDHASRYIGKIFNDEWMRERGFLDAELSVRNVIEQKKDKGFHSIDKNETIKNAFNIMKSHDISQMPVTNDGEIIGSITESSVLNYLLENPTNNIEAKLEEIMGESFPIVQEDLLCKQLNRYMDKNTPAVLAKDKAGILHLITQYDVIQTV